MQKNDSYEIGNKRGIVQNNKFFDANIKKLFVQREKQMGAL